MKNNVNEESLMENITVDNDFEGFNYDEDEAENNYDNFETMENTIQVLDTKKIDAFVDKMDYMWFQEYLDWLEENDKNEALEYVKNNYSEFMEDEEWNIFEPMKWWKFDTDKEIARDFNKKSNFDKTTIKSDLWETLLNSYKNAA